LDPNRSAPSLATQASPTGNVYDLSDGKIRRIRIFVDRDEALEAVGLRE